MEAKFVLIYHLSDSVLGQRATLLHLVIQGFASFHLWFLPCSLAWQNLLPQAAKEVEDEEGNVCFLKCPDQK